MNDLGLTEGKVSKGGINRDRPKNQRPPAIIGQGRLDIDYVQSNYVKNKSLCCQAVIALRKTVKNLPWRCPICYREL